MGRIALRTSLPVLIGLSMVVLASWSTGCGDEAAPAGAGAETTPCYVDMDCPPGYGCFFDELGAGAMGRCVETELTAPKGDTYGAPCLSFEDCAEDEECCQGVCVGSNECSVDNPSTTPDVQAPVNDPEPECSGEGDCAPSEECCDGQCVSRGQCDSSTNPGGGLMPLPDDSCSTDGECEVSEQCCDGSCVLRGQCASDNNNNFPPNNNGTGSSSCAQRCETINSCSTQICGMGIIDIDQCVALCQSDPTAIGPDTNSCAAINADLCMDAMVEMSCECGSSGGPNPQEPQVGAPCTSDAVCMDSWGDGFCLTEVNPNTGEQTAWVGGYCSKMDCWFNWECGDQGFCFEGSRDSFCLRDCEPGWTECDRAGYVCQPLGVWDAACVPACQSDAECGDGYFCGSDGVCY